MNPFKSCFNIEFGRLRGVFLVGVLMLARIWLSQYVKPIIFGMIFGVILARIWGKYGVTAI